MWNTRTHTGVPLLKINIYMIKKNIWKIDSIDKQEMIGFSRDIIDGEHELHGHEFMEIEYIEKGCVVQNINDKEYVGQKGDFFVLYKGDIHGYVTKEPSEIVNLIFYSELYDETFWQDFCLQSKVKLGHKVHLKKPEREKLATLLDLMEDEFNNKKENYIFILRQLLHVVIATLVRAEKKNNNVFNTQISDIIKHIEENIQKVTVIGLAKHFGYSANHFTKIFKKNLGVTPIEYINKRKIIAVIKQLIQTDNSIESIMFDHGFYNKTHFYDLFKRYTKHLPKELRETRPNNILQTLDNFSDSEDIKKVFNPIYKSSFVKDEILVFAKEDGKITAHLAFDGPKKAIIVDRNGAVLKKGIDYKINGTTVTLLNNKLNYFESEWLKNKDVPQYIPTENEVYGIEDCLLVVPDYLRKMQYLVSYHHSNQSFPKIFEQEIKLYRTAEKLNRDKKLNIVLFGDSISNAANSSYELGHEGYRHWIKTVKKRIETHYGAQVGLVNASRSGYGTEWALIAIEEKVNCQETDLLIIAFGMNDGTEGLSIEQFTENVKKLMKKASEKNPYIEFILVATPTPNAECGKLFKEQKNYINGLKKLEQEGVAVVNMTAVFDFLQKNKRYIEISGNNLNHPNDFGYAFYEDAFTELLFNLKEKQNIENN